MNKVVAFLEKYAEWVALSLAALFLLYMVYDNVVSPDAIRTKVGGQQVLPGDVDPELSKTVVTGLQQKIEAPAGNLQGAFEVKDATKEFEYAMGPKRPRMEAEYVIAQSVRPFLPGQRPEDVNQPAGGIEIAKLPDIPTPVHNGVATGNSMVAAPAPMPAEGDELAEQPIQPPVEDPAVMLANALDKYWVMVEWKFPMKELAQNWKKVFPPGSNVPLEAMKTVFVDVEVEREELIGPGQWGNKTVVQPLPLMRRPQYPGNDPEAQEIFRAWAEKNQVNVVEPPFYRVLKGDPWYIPSIGQPKDPNGADATLADQPFDPANPPTNRPLTTQEKQAVYLYNKKIRDEAEKAKAMERKAKMDAASQNKGGSTGGSGGGGRRTIGGYAPLPIELASSGPDLSDNNRRPVPRGNPAERRPTGQPPRRTDDAGRPIGPNVPARRTDDAGRPIGPTTPEIATGPTIDPSGVVQNPLLTGPFDPARVPVDVKGNIADLPVWAYDETAVPGKTYRYRMRIKLKNPIFHTFGLTAKGKEALADQFAVESKWSEWKEVTAPRTTEFFFANKRQPIGGGKTVTHVVVDVFKHQKGEWSTAQFVLTPGDVVGATKGEVDYSTGNTIVDFRLDTREKDVHILLADDTGNIETRSLDTDVNDTLYKALQEKVRAATNAAAAGAASGTGATGALINEVGTRVRD